MRRHARTAAVRSRASQWLALGLLATGVTTTDAQGTCSATGVMAGEAFVANHCAAAVSSDDRSVTLWFSETPLSPEEIEAFQLSAYANSAKDGKERTMLLVAFCPGGGQEVASAAAVTQLDLGLNHAKSPMASAQWVVEAPADFTVQKIAGTVSAGGHLAGRITGKRSSDGRPYAWDLTFDVTLPAHDAASGITCGK